MRGRLKPPERRWTALDAHRCRARSHLEHHTPRQRSNTEPLAAMLPELPRAESGIAHYLNPCKAKGKGCAWSTGFGVRRAPREQSWPSRSSSALGTPGERCGRARTRGCCTAKRWGGLHMLGGSPSGLRYFKKKKNDSADQHGRCAMVADVCTTLARGRRVSLGTLPGAAPVPPGMVVQH